MFSLTRLFLNSEYFNAKCGHVPSTDCALSSEKADLGSQHLGLPSPAYNLGRNRQKGASSLSLLVYICFGAIVLVGVLKVLPVYLEHKKIQSVLEGVAEGFATESQLPSKSALQKKLAKRFSMESISAITVKDIDFKKEGKSWVLNAGYEKRVDIYNNVALLVDFTQVNPVVITSR